MRGSSVGRLARALWALGVNADSKAGESPCPLSCQQPHPSSSPLVWESYYMRLVSASALPCPVVLDHCFTYCSTAMSQTGTHPQLWPGKCNTMPQYLRILRERLLLMVLFLCPHTGTATGVLGELGQACLCLLYQSGPAPSEDP